MEFLIIIPIALYMLVFIPAFMFTWEGSVFDGIGCYGWLCMLIGFPGALLALFIKLAIKLFKLPAETRNRREQQIREQQLAQEERRLEEQERLKQQEYQISLEQKRNSIYPNSPITKEIVDMITANNLLPYSVEVKGTGVIACFEGFTKQYVFKSHSLPDMDRNEQQIFADVLVDKLNRQYTVRELTKYHSFMHSDGTPGGWTEHISFLLERKITRSF